MEQETKTEKKAITVRTYILTVTDWDDGSSTFKRENKGFNPLELIGLAEFLAVDVREQIMGRLKFDEIAGTYTRVEKNTNPEIQNK